MKPSEKYANELATQAASLSILPFWYPLFAKSLYQRSQILESKTPGDLSHTKFFSNKRNYYRGITANLSLQPLFPLSQWLLTTILEKFAQINERHPVIAEKIFAGFITGCSTAAIANPYETTVIASQKNNISPVKAFAKILKDSGPSGFYTGTIPMAVRNGVFCSGLFVSTPYLQKQLEEFIPGTGRAHQVATTVAGSVIPATIFTMVAVPLDLAAVMRQSDPSGKIFDSSVHALNAAYKKHGLAALKVGGLLRLFATVVEMTGFNLFNEEYQKKFRP